MVTPVPEPVPWPPNPPNPSEPLPELLPVVSMPRKAVSPIWTVEDPLPLSIWLAMDSALSIGMAYACSWLPWEPD